MSSEQIIWVLVAIVVVGALIGVAMMASKRRSATVEHRRHEAEQLREDAAAGASGLTASQAQAQQARAEAEAAQARATQAEHGAAMDEATVEDRVREADRLDPDVDHRSEEYQPEAPTEPAERSAPVAEQHPPADPAPDPDTAPDDEPPGTHRA